MPYKYRIVKNNIHEHMDFHSFELVKINYDDNKLITSIESTFKFADISILPMLLQLEEMAKAFKSKTEDWQPFEFDVDSLSYLNYLMIMKKPYEDSK